jgi:hypothetical protein
MAMPYSSCAPLRVGNAPNGGFFEATCVSGIEGEIFCVRLVDDLSAKCSMGLSLFTIGDSA